MQAFQGTRAQLQGQGAAGGGVARYIRMRMYRPAVPDLDGLNLNLVALGRARGHTHPGSIVRISARHRGSSRREHGVQSAYGTARHQGSTQGPAQGQAGRRPPSDDAAGRLKQINPPIALMGPCLAPAARLALFAAPA
eukprot:SAG31_NODE_1851_length_7077_cov_2.680854_9_plen_138_part_00